MLAVPASGLARVLLLLFLPVTSAASQTVDSYLVSDFDSGTVQIFSVTTNQLLETIQAGSSPNSALVSPDGRLAYVQNLNSNYLSVLDLTIGAEITRIPQTLSILGGGITGAITADGNKVLLSSNPGQLTILNTADFTITAVPLGPVCDDSSPSNCDSDPNDLRIFGIAIAGGKAYVNLETFSFPVRIVSVDLNSFVVSTIPGTAIGNDLTLNSIVATPDNRFVIVERSAPNRLLVVDTATNSVAQSVTPGIFPRQIAVTTPGGTSNGVFVYLLGTDSSNNVVVDDYSFSGGILNLAGSLSLFPLTSPIRECLSPDSSRFYVSEGGTVTALDTQAIINDPSAAVVGRFAIANQINGMAGANVQLQSPATAPTVTGITPRLILSNDTTAGRTIEVSGTNFSPDALLRVGNLLPFAPGASSSSLQAVVPSNAPAQVADIIVTDPNSGSSTANQHQSGILRGQFIIASPPTFQPVNQAVVANGGNSTVSILNVSTNASLQPVLPGVLGALGVAITPDGERAYIGEFVPPAIHVINLVQNQLEATIPLESNGALGQIDGVALTPTSPFGGPVVYAVASKPLPDGNSDQELFVIDADPAHAGSTLNTILATQPAGQDLLFSMSGALGASPDGRFIYTNALQDFSCSVGWLIIFDVVSGTSNTIPASALNLNGCQFHIEVSPDGKSLLLNSADGRILVFDISADPMNPTQKAAIAPQAPLHFTVSNPPIFRILPGTPNSLFALDQNQDFVVAFNFDQATANFAQLGSIVIPGSGGGVALGATPDGKLLYAVLSFEDDVAVLDPALLAQSDPAALITKIFTGIGPSSIAIRPGTPTPASTAANSIVNVVPTMGITISFSDVTSAGATTVSTTNTTPFSAPAGFQISGLPVYYELDTTAVFSSAVVCLQYDPARVPNPESSLRLAHYNRAIDPVTNQVIGWEDVTIPGSPDTTTHTICGQVSSFSPFVIGIASVDFLFNSLLADISTLSPATTPIGVMRSLRAKALAARASAVRGNDTSAENQLNALIQQLQALSGKQVTTTDANTLIGETDAILSNL